MEYERAYLHSPDDWEKVTEEYVRKRLDGHQANPLMLCADCAEVDRQMELRSEIDRRRRTEDNDTVP